MLRKIIYTTVLLLKILVSNALLASGQVFDCSGAQLERCKIQIEQQIDTSAYKSRLTENESCDLTRASFDCVVWYSTHCLDARGRSLVGPLVSAARQHLVTRCEWEDHVNEGWSDKSCFRNEEVMQCNDHFSSTKYGYGSECLRYNDYEQCIRDVIKNRGCESKFVSTYLYDRGSTSAWLCQARDFRGITPISATFVTELTESMSCVSRIADQIRGCPSDHWRSPNAVLDVVQDGCCAYYSKLECVKRAALSYCEGQSYLHVMKAMEQTLTGRYCTDGFARPEECSSSTSVCKLSIISCILIAVISLFML